MCACDHVYTNIINEVLLFSWKIVKHWCDEFSLLRPSRNDLYCFLLTHEAFGLYSTCSFLQLKAELRWESIPEPMFYDPAR